MDSSLIIIFVICICLCAIGMVMSFDADRDVGKLTHEIKMLRKEMLEIKMKDDTKEVTVAGWIARDKCGELWVYKDRIPQRKEDMFCGYSIFRLPDNSMSHISWDSEPKEVELTIKIEE